MANSASMDADDDVSEQGQEYSVPALLEASRLWAQDLTVVCNGKKGRLLPGHVASVQNVYVCMDCTNKPQDCKGLEDWIEQDCGRAPGWDRQGEAFTDEEIEAHIMTEVKVHAPGEPVHGKSLLEYCRDLAESSGGPALAGQHVWIYWTQQLHEGTDASEVAVLLSTAVEPGQGVWYEGEVVAYDEVTGQFTVFYKSDQTFQNVYMDLTFLHWGDVCPSLNRDTVVRRPTPAVCPGPYGQEPSHAAAGTLPEADGAPAATSAPAAPAPAAAAQPVSALGRAAAAAAADIDADMSNESPPPADKASQPKSKHGDKGTTAAGKVGGSSDAAPKPGKGKTKADTAPKPSKGEAKTDAAPKAGKGEAVLKAAKGTADAGPAPKAGKGEGKEAPAGKAPADAASKPPASKKDKGHAGKDAGTSGATGVATQAKGEGDAKGGQVEGKGPERAGSLPLLPKAKGSGKGHAGAMAGLTGAGAKGQGKGSGSVIKPTSHPAAAPPPPPAPGKPAMLNALGPSTFDWGSDDDMDGGFADNPDALGNVPIAAGEAPGPAGSGDTIPSSEDSQQGGQGEPAVESRAAAGTSTRGMPGQQPQAGVVASKAMQAAGASAVPSTAVGGGRTKTSTSLIHPAPVARRASSSLLTPSPLQATLAQCSGCSWDSIEALTQALAWLLHSNWNQLRQAELDVSHRLGPLQSLTSGTGPAAVSTGNPSLVAAPCGEGPPPLLGLSGVERVAAVQRVHDALVVAARKQKGVQVVQGRLGATPQDWPYSLHKACGPLTARLSAERAYLLEAPATAAAAGADPASAPHQPSFQLSLHRAHPGAQDKRALVPEPAAPEAAGPPVPRPPEAGPEVEHTSLTLGSWVVNLVGLSHGSQQQGGASGKAGQRPAVNRVYVQATWYKPPDFPAIELNAPLPMSVCSTMAGCLLHVGFILARIASCDAGSGAAADYAERLLGCLKACNSMCERACDAYVKAQAKSVP